jgi:hypothetical protein
MSATFRKETAWVAVYEFFRNWSIRGGEHESRISLVCGNSFFVFAVVSATCPKLRNH